MKRELIYEEVLAMLNDRVDYKSITLSEVAKRCGMGKSTIYDLKYTPDWKYDPDTELESYAIRREPGSEVVLSLINRSNNNSVNVSVNTGKLPADLCVWAYRVKK